MKEVIDRSRSLNVGQWYLAFNTGGCMECTWYIILRPTRFH